MATKRKKKIDEPNPNRPTDMPVSIAQEYEPEQAPPEPKPVAPEPETSKTEDVVYMPGPEGPDDTEVAGIKFHAYEPVGVHVSRQNIIQKLHANPWFGPKVDKARQQAWSDYRAAQAAARKAKEDAEELLASKS